MSSYPSGAHATLKDVSEQRIALWKRLFMWDYPRGSVAYDLMVGAILAFIFLTPPAVFRDKPLLSKARDEIVMLPGASGETRFWLEESLIQTIPVDHRMERLSELLTERTGMERRAVTLEALRSADDALHGYVVVTRP
ncbi:MAG: hypothetical protein KIT83_07540 [Bryobacterales bacterium]|nr:hypothetical protein [Bryobacterales bacterium]